MDSKIKKKLDFDSYEDLLLTLSIECLEAKELAIGMESLKKYFKARFHPVSMEISEVEPNLSEIFRFPQGKIFYIEEQKFYFLMRFAIPMAVCLRGSQEAPPTLKELNNLEKIIQFFSEKLDAFADLRGLTYTDDLTGLYNQRYLELVLDRELSLAKRGKNEFSVLFLDLDHFKKVNDTHGHIVGSRLLFEVSQEIKKALRDTDITFRYGGDEFVAILSQTGLESAMHVAERIRTQVEKKRFLIRDGMELRMTTSIGVATVPIHATTKKEILTVADQALYGVKKTFRNKVIAASDILVQAKVHSEKE